jgi:hypothetical protein
MAAAIQIITMSLATQMSKAIREVIESHAPNLSHLKDETLEAFAEIITAFMLDLESKLARRKLLRE